MSAIVPPFPPPKPGYYSAHFSKTEMCASDQAARQGIDNTPPPHVETNLSRLCLEFLEKLRTQFGPIRVTSGYRCPDLNELIGGSTTSAHPDGRAADLQPLRPVVSLRSIVEWIAESDLPVDQVILEYSTWVHLGIAKAGQKPRREVLMISHGTGYAPYTKEA